MNLLLGLIKRKKLVHMIMLFIIIVGVIQLKNTKNQGYPSVDFGVMNINTLFPGASPDEVELKVTGPIEDELLTVTGIDQIESYSVEGLSVISIKLDDNYDYIKTKNDIYKAVDRVENLPSDVDSKPKVTEVLNDAQPVQEIAIYGSADYRILRKYAVALEKQLQENSLIGKVQRIGYREREVNISADQDKLVSNYLSLSDIVSALQTHNIRKSGGNITTALEETKLVLNSELQNLKETRDIVIRSNFNGGSITIGDIAIVSDGYSPEEIVPLYNGQPMIQLLVQKKQDSDILKTSESITKIISNFKNNIPDSVQIDSIVDYTVEVKSLLKLVLDNGKMGLILVVLALLLLLNFKVAMWTALGIPISILFGFIFFPIFGLTINFITLMAIILILGMVVDDAIIMGENIYRYREMGYPPLEAVEKGMREVIAPVVTTVLTTIVAFLPMMFMGGIFGKFMYMMPIAIALILIGSLIECLFLLPSHITHTKIEPSDRKTVELFHSFEVHYESFIAFALKFKYYTISFFIGFLMLALYLGINHIPFLLFPSNDGLFGTISYELPNGTSLQQNQEWVKQVEQKLSELPDNELDSFVTTLGQAKPRISDFGQSQILDSVGNILINLSAYRNRTRTATDIMHDLKYSLSNVTGAVKMKVDVTEDGPPVGKPVTVTFIDNDDLRRNKHSVQLKKFLKSIPGVFNVDDSEGIGRNELILQVDYDKMYELGVSPKAIGDTLRSSIEGRIATDTQWDGEEVSFRVQLSSSQRNNLHDLSRLMIRNRFGKLIPLGHFVSFEKKPAKEAITHFDGDRSITIYAEVDSEQILPSEVNKQIYKIFSEIADATPGFRLRFGGQEKDTQESMQSLAIAMCIALVAIYMILVVLFDSFVQPFLVMSAIPFSFCWCCLCLFPTRSTTFFPWYDWLNRLNRCCC